jgi:hypothetical protein
MSALGKYSVGVGDRFGKSGPAQAAAALDIKKEAGVELDLVWNKSKREHAIIGTSPADQRAAADAAVKAAGWKGAYHVDADHVGAASVEAFIPHCDFFTIDVADDIGKAAPAAERDAFLARRADLVGSHAVPGLAAPLVLSRDAVAAAADRYLGAAKEAGAVYRKIKAGKGAVAFAAEVSMDETADPQSPAELLVILAALADAGVPADTIAPKFSGRFNKGVEYVGDPAAFLAEFEADVAVAGYAAKRFGLPAGLKLSVHSGSDKFSLYKGIAKIIRATGAGLHLKTAGTTWLEELVGLAEAGGDGLAMAKGIYRAAYGRFDELVAPYAPVVDIDRASLPKPDSVDAWAAGRFAAALRHDRSVPEYDPNLRQLLHVGYKVAAELGPRYLAALAEHRSEVERNVRANLLERHFRPLFGKA